MNFKIISVISAILIHKTQCKDEPVAITSNNQPLVYAINQQAYEPLSPAKDQGKRYVDSNIEINGARRSGYHQFDIANTGYQQNTPGISLDRDDKYGRRPDQSFNTYNGFTPQNGYKYPSQDRLNPFNKNLNPYDIRGQDDTKIGYQFGYIERPNPGEAQIPGQFGYGDNGFAQFGQEQGQWDGQYAFQPFGQPQFGINVNGDRFNYQRPEHKRFGFGYNQGYDQVYDQGYDRYNW